MPLFLARAKLKIDFYPVCMCGYRWFVIVISASAQSENAFVIIIIFFLLREKQRIYYCNFARYIYTTSTFQNP